MNQSRFSLGKGQRHIPPVIIILLILLTATSLTARIPLMTDRPTAVAKINDPPCADYAVHDINLLGMTVTNTGSLGKGYTPGIPSEVPSGVYPYPGDRQFLFAGALWIGAIVGNDTLVSVGADGWNITREMWPEACPDGEIIEENNISDQDIIAVFTDTLTDPAYVNNDPWSGRPHLPLNVEITQKSYAWSQPGAEDFIIFEYNVKNIGGQPLERAWIGFYIDGDVLYHDQTTGFDDDICGLLPAMDRPYGNCTYRDSLNIAWIADNNGLDDNNPAPGDSLDFPAVTGLCVLRTPSDSMTTNFNWWISNGNPTLDWGPRQDEDPFRDFGGFLGTPEGDENKHYIISHEEVDYDQLFAAVDHTAEGWLPPDAVQSGNFADGYDTRYLLSFGPFEIEPDETLPFYVAYIAGDNFHTDPDAFDNLFDPLAPDTFYNQLNFNDLAANAIAAKWTFDNPGVDTDGDGYRGKFRLCVHDSALVYDTVQYDPLIVDTVWVNTDADTIFYEGDGVPDLNPFFICGDVNLDGFVGLLDITALISYLYSGGPEPPGFFLADVDNSGIVNLLDIIYLIRYLYHNGPAPNC